MFAMTNAFLDRGKKEPNEVRPRDLGTKCSLKRGYSSREPGAMKLAGSMINFDYC